MYDRLWILFWLYQLTAVHVTVTSLVNKALLWTDVTCHRDFANSLALGVTKAFLGANAFFLTTIIRYIQQPSKRFMKVRNSTGVSTRQDRNPLKRWAAVFFCQPLQQPAFLLITGQHHPRWRWHPPINLVIFNMCSNVIHCTAAYSCCAKWGIRRRRRPQRRQ